MDAWGTQGVVCMNGGWDGHGMPCPYRERRSL
jgi:hypothetical protein